MTANRKRTASPARTRHKQTAKPRSSKNSSASQRRGAIRKASGARANSKQDRVIAMLRQTDGTTVAAVMKATGWQKHSVHGFFAGVVRRKLAQPLQSEKRGGQRVYRIATAKPAEAPPKPSRKQTS